MVLNLQSGSTLKRVSRVSLMRIKTTLIYEHTSPSLSMSLRGISMAGLNVEGLSVFSAEQNGVHNIRNA